MLFSPGIPVSSTNTTDRYDIAEILLKVDAITITLTHVFLSCLDITSTVSLYFKMSLIVFIQVAHELIMLSSPFLQRLQSKMVKC
jgi:hypothetical protein